MQAVGVAPEALPIRFSELVLANAVGPESVDVLAGGAVVIQDVACAAKVVAN